MLLIAIDLQDKAHSWSRVCNTSNSGGLSHARHVVSLDKELHSTWSLFTQVGGGGGNPAILLGIIHENRDKLRSFGPLARVPLWPFFFKSKKRQAIIEVA